MVEPRKVTAPNGAIRWVASDGRTFETEAEAKAASGADEFEELRPLEPPQEPPPNRITLFVIYAGMLVGCGWLTEACIERTWKGTWHFDSDWQWLTIPVFTFFTAGAAITGAVGLYGLITKRDDLNPGAVWEWWVGKLGCGLLWVIGGLIALVLGWVLIDAFFGKAFEGVSNGTAMIIVLLFFILITLTQIASNSNRR